MKPKFRAWHKDSKLMLDVLAIDFKHKHILADIETRKIYPDFGYWWKETDIPFSEIILMQSTGLFDKNGVEIYEGDIVKVTDDYGDTNFSDGGIGTICGLTDLYMWYIDGQVHNGLYDIDQCYYIEVIGNIYKNKELLEAMK